MRFERMISAFEGSFLELEPLLSFSTADCQLVKETKTGDEQVPEWGLLSLELQFSRNELLSYTEYRKTELTRKSADWINRASNAFWLCTSGTISVTTLTNLRKKTLAKYECESSKSKVLTFAVAFLKYLAKIRLDLRYRSFELFLERPRRIKVRKNVTSRIVTKEDIERVLDHIHSAEVVEALAGRERSNTQHLQFLAHSLASGAWQR